MGQRFRIGNVEVAVAQDAVLRLAPITFLPDVPPEAWQPYTGNVPTAEDTFDSRVLCFVLRSQGKTILVDAGVGQWGLWEFGDGTLPDALRAIDVGVEDIDFVMPTHLHRDHVGWNTRPSDNGPVPTFTKARYLFQREEWDYFTSPSFMENPVFSDNMKSMIRLAVYPLKDTGLMDLIGYEHAVTDEVTLLHTPGHTPGSVTVLIQSAGESAMILGDAAHHPAQLTETDWTPMIDIDRSLSARSRRAIVDEARRRDALIAGTHFNGPAKPIFGRMIEIEGRPVWRGVDL